MGLITNRSSGGSHYKSGYSDLTDHGVVGNCRTAGQPVALDMEGLRSGGVGVAEEGQD